MSTILQVVQPDWNIRPREDLSLRPSMIYWNNKWVIWQSAITVNVSTAAALCREAVYQVIAKASTSSAPIEKDVRNED